MQKIMIKVNEKYQKFMQEQIGQLISVTEAHHPQAEARHRKRKMSKAILMLDMAIQKFH